MKNTLTIFLALALIGCVYSSTAQEQPAATDTGLANGLGMYVFPSKNQDQKTQDADEMECYRWAVQQSGFDPLKPVKVAPGQVDKGPDGSSVGGAARGAAAGAAIGAIAGDAGKGAAIGAVAGAVQGRRAKVAGDQRKQQQMNQAAAAKEKEMMDNFKKAFSACMEGKGYTVK